MAYQTAGDHETIILLCCDQTHCRQVWARIWRGGLSLGGRLTRPRQIELPKLGHGIEIDHREWRILGAWRKSRAFGRYEQPTA